MPKLEIRNLKLDKGSDSCIFPNFKFQISLPKYKISPACCGINYFLALMKEAQPFIRTLPNQIPFPSQIGLKVKQKPKLLGKR
jgi:hypothetical protein